MAKSSEDGSYPPRGNDAPRQPQQRRRLARNNLFVKDREVLDTKVHRNLVMHDSVQNGRNDACKDDLD